jgi:uncharacterized membrane protein
MRAGLGALVRIAIVGALPVALYAARVLYTHERTYGFLLFNLTLAALPLAFATWAHHEHAAMERGGVTRKLRLGAALALWLLFLPNAPYLVTDFVHLHASRGVPLWYDIALLASFAFAGMVYGIASLALVHDMAIERFGAIVGWLFVVSVACVSGVGIWIGRFLRWNSWDLVLQPDAVVRDAFAELAHPIRHPTPWGVTAVFAALLLATYASFRFSKRWISAR